MNQTTYTCPVCQNSEHSEGARFCKICGKRLPEVVKLPEENSKPQRVPLKFKDRSLRWVQLDDKSIQYMAQLAFVDKAKEALHKAHILKTLGIEPKPGEKPLAAWVRVMAEENKLDIEMAQAWIAIEGAANKSLAAFLMTMA